MLRGHREICRPVVLRGAYAAHMNNKKAVKSVQQLPYVGPCVCVTVTNMHPTCVWLVAAHGNFRLTAESHGIRVTIMPNITCIVRLGIFALCR